jgi:small subunit ribosomal protein S1
MEGLIHISELSDNRINHPKEVVKEGDVLTLRVIKIDPERRRIGLSLRKVDSPAYADLDWKMALSGEVEGANLPPHMAEENQQKATPTEEVSSVAPAIDAQAVNDLAEAPEVALAEDLTEMPMVEEFSEEGEQG